MRAPDGLELPGRGDGSGLLRAADGRWGSTWSHQHLPYERAAEILTDWAQAPISVATLQAFVAQGAEALDTGRSSSSATRRTPLSPTTVMGLGASPQYLRGVEGVAMELGQHTATLCVHGPVGRFRTGTIRECPPLLLERMNPAA